MKYTTIMLLALISMLSACKTQHKSNLKNDKEISLISLSRTPCFGTCPVYTLQIDKNCIATLDAQNHLPNGLTGWHQANLPEKEWMKLAQMLEKISLQDLADSYGNRQITDLPSVNTAVTYADGNLKKVNDYGARGTAELQALYKHVDQLVAELDWEPTEKLD